jgi:hypothetical protein
VAAEPVVDLPRALAEMIRRYQAPPEQVRADAIQTDRLARASR